MAVETSFTTSLSESTVENSVRMFPQSLKFTRRFIGVSISSILFERLNCDLEANFEIHNYADVEYAVIKKNCKENLLKHAFYTICGIKNALNNHCVQNLRMVFYDKNIENVLDVYEYKFSYNNEQCVEDIQLSQTEVIKNFAKHISIIQKLRAFKKLEPNVSICFFMTKNNNVKEGALEKCTSPFFVKPSAREWIIWEHSGNWTENCQNIDMKMLSTGYHGIDCSGYIRKTQLKESVQSTNVNSDISLSSKSSLGVEEKSRDENTTAFDCICKIEDEIDFIEKLTCVKCNKFFHKPCASLFTSDFSTSFICIKCTKNDSDFYRSKLSETEQVDLAITMLALHHMLKTKLLPSVNVWIKLRKSWPWIEKFKRFCSQNQILPKNSKSLTSNFDVDKIEEIINKINNPSEFDNFRLPYSENDDVLYDKEIFEEKRNSFEFDNLNFSSSEIEGKSNSLEFDSLNLPSSEIEDFQIKKRKRFKF